MAHIEFQNGSKFLTIASGLITVAALWSSFKGDETVRPLALNIALASGAIATTNHLLSKYYEDSANSQLQRILNETIKSVSKLESEAQHKNTLLAEIQSLHERAKNRIDECDIHEKSLSNAIEILKLELAKKTKELQELSESRDTRVQEFQAQFKQELAQNISDRIHRIYNGLAENVKSRIGKDDYQIIHEQLQNFNRNLDDLYAHHCDLLLEIPDLEGDDIIPRSINIYSQICDEVSALKVRFRNLLNIHERQELERSLETLGRMSETHLPRQKAMNIVDKELNDHKQTLERILNHSKDNDTSLQELRNQVQDLLNEIESKNLEISDLKRPLRWAVATRDDLRIGNLIILYFENLGIVLDRAGTDYRKHDATLSFHIDRNPRYIAPSELNEHSEKLQMASHVLAPIKFVWDADTGVMKAEIKIARKDKSTESLTDKIPHCRELVKESRRGFLITGHPASGKTSSMIAIAQMLGNEQSMRIALNPHNDDKSSFERYGFVELNKLDDIYEAISQLNDELILRGEDKNRRKTLIICIDELGRILANAPKGLDIMSIIKQAAVEGRKFNLIVLLANHSQTTEAIEMDSQFRESFYQLFLVGAATHKLNMPNAPTLKREEVGFIETAPYPVLTSINGRYRACQHPTHWLYPEVKDTGNPPIGLEDMSPNPVVLGNRIFGNMLEQTKCPHCGSTNVKLNAKGRDRHICNACGQSFTAKV